MFRFRSAGFALRIFLGLTTIAAAQSGITLEWKFTPGETVNLEMSQSIAMKMDVAGRAMNNTTETKSWMSWKCVEVDSDGIATIESTVDRMKMELQTPLGPMKFDTADEEDSPQSAALAGQIRPIVGKVSTQQMNPSGKIVEATLPEEVKDMTSRAMGSSDMLKTLSTNASLTFPEEPLKVGDTWSENMEVPSPVGQMKLTRTHTYKGPVTVDGRELHHFDVDLKMEFVNTGAGPSIEIVDQKTKGNLYFDGAKGRVESSKVQQTATMRITSGAYTVDQTLEQNIDLKVSDGSAALKKAA